MSAYYPAFPEGNLARVHFIIGHAEDEFPKVKRETLEETVRSIVRTWEDAVAEVGDRHGTAEFTPWPLPFRTPIVKTFLPMKRWSMPVALPVFHATIRSMSISIGIAPTGPMPLP